jgi:hypothetical protein
MILYEAPLRKIYIVLSNKRRKVYWRLVARYKLTNVSEEHDASIFRVKTILPWKLRGYDTSEHW